MKAANRKGVNNMYCVGDGVVVKDNRVDPSRLKIGMKGRIIVINEHFMLVRFSELGYPIMFAHAEFFATFKKYEKKERVWTAWEYYPNGCDFINANDKLIKNSFDDADVYVRNNGKRVQVRDEKTLITAEASCNDCDEFDLQTGIELATARLSIKLTQRSIQDRISEME